MSKTLLQLNQDAPAENLFPVVPLNSSPSLTWKGNSFGYTTNTPVSLPGFSEVEGYVALEIPNTTNPFNSAKTYRIYCFAKRASSGYHLTRVDQNLALTGEQMEEKGIQ